MHFIRFHSAVSSSYSPKNRNMFPDFRISFILSSQSPLRFFHTFCSKPTRSYKYFPLLRLGLHLASSPFFQILPFGALTWKYRKGYGHVLVFDPKPKNLKYLLQPMKSRWKVGYIDKNCLHNLHHLYLEIYILKFNDMCYYQKSSHLVSWLPLLCNPAICHDCRQLLIVAHQNLLSPSVVVSFFRHSHHRTYLIWGVKISNHEYSPCVS